MMYATKLIRETKEVIQKILNAIPNGGDEILEIGIRFDDKRIDKVATRVNELLRTVWMLIDKKHELIRSHYSAQEVESIFYQDKAGTIIYDSANQKPSSDEIKFKTEPNQRMKEFKNLSPEDKTRVSEITAEQIKSSNNEELLKEKEKEVDGWDDLPFLKQ